MSPLVPQVRLDAQETEGFHLGESRGVVGFEGLRRGGVR